MPVEGLARCITAFRKMQGKDHKSVEDSVKQGCEIILRKAKQYVPKDTRELERSGHVEIEGSGARTKGAVVFDAEHAIPVHEDMEANHAEGTGAKYLERAARESKGTIAAATRRIIKVS